jgi:hypothetical protein
MRVLHNGNASVFQTEDEGSIPFTRFMNDLKYYTWLAPGQPPGICVGEYIGRYLEKNGEFHYLIFADAINVRAIDDETFNRARLATEQEILEAVEYEKTHEPFGLHPYFLGDNVE